MSITNENNCLYVSSRGIMKSCDVYSNQPISSIRQMVSYDFSLLKNGSTLYICSSAIPYFIHTTFNKINVKFILVDPNPFELRITKQNSTLISTKSDFFHLKDDAPIFVHFSLKNNVYN